jgi:hypothetical protein
VLTSGGTPLYPSASLLLTPPPGIMYGGFGTSGFSAAGNQGGRRAYAPRTTISVGPQMMGGGGAAASSTSSTRYAGAAGRGSKVHVVEVHFMVALCDTTTAACNVRLVAPDGRTVAGSKLLELHRMDSPRGGESDLLYSGDDVSMFAHLYQGAHHVPVDDQGDFRWQVVVARQRGRGSGLLFQTNVFVENACHDRRWTGKSFRCTRVSTAPGALRPHAFAVVGDNFDKQVSNALANNIVPATQYAEGFARLLPRAAAFLFAKDVPVAEVFAPQLSDVVVPQMLQPTEVATLKSVDPSTELAALCFRSVRALFRRVAAAAAADDEHIADMTTLFLRWATTLHVVASRHCRAAVPLADDETARFIDTLNARQVGFALSATRARFRCGSSTLPLRRARCACSLANPFAVLSRNTCGQIFTALKDHRENDLMRRSVKGLLDPYIQLRRNVAAVAHWALLLIALGWGDDSLPGVLSQHSAHVLTCHGAWFADVPKQTKVGAPCAWLQQKLLAAATDTAAARLLRPTAWPSVVVVVLARREIIRYGRTVTAVYAVLCACA